MDLEIKEWIFQFKDYLISERKLSRNTVQAYYQDVLQFYLFLEDLEQASNLKDYFRIEILDQYLIYLNNSLLNNRSILRKISALSTLLKFLKNEGVIEENQIFLLNRPKTGLRLPRYLTVDEVEKLINFFDPQKPAGIRDRAIFELIYSCGLRVSELSGLNVADIYLQERILRVMGKGSRERYVPIGEKAISALLDYFKKSRAQLMKSKTSSALFLNFRGGRLTRKGIWKNLKKAAAYCLDNKEITVHSLRHSFATHLIQNGADIRGVQTLLGHKSINTTEIYTHLNLDFIRNVYDRFHSHS